MASHLRRALAACARTARARGGVSLARAASSASATAILAGGALCASAALSARLAECERAEPPPRPPPEHFFGDTQNDPVARNLEVDVARVQAWKALIGEARELWRAGQRAQAEATLRAALEQAHYFGDRGPPVATSLFNLAELLRRLGGARRAEAAGLYEQALDIFETTAGPAHRTTTTCMSALAELHADSGRHAQSAALLEAAAERLRGAVGEEPRRSPALAATLLRLGDAQQELGQVERAEKTFDESHALCAKLWGANHARTVPARVRLAEVQLARGRLEEARRTAEAALADAATDAQRARLQEVCRKAR